MDVRKIRKSVGLSQAALAAKTGIERTRLSFAENGYVALNPNEHAAIRHAVLGELERQAVQRSAVMKQIGVAV
jgi:transcriptional regulator with XRE-family HTH domain